MANELILQLLTVFPPDLLPKPWLGIQPATIVSPGTNVTLSCQAPQPAWTFALFRAGEATLLQNASEEFFLEEVTPAQGGGYHCRYQAPGWGLGVWSPPSNALELLVLDQLPRPSLVALPGPVVAPGANVSLRCAGSLGGMSFALYRVGLPTPLSYSHSEQHWADFPLPSTHAPGTYVCYYHTPSAPYVLSQRSHPLVIRPDGSRNYTQGNAARLGMAGLVLLSLGTLGMWEWRGRSRPPRPRSEPRAGSPSGLDVDTTV
ncbi:osteoclast-associated immunoglobulin-like receptor isoform X2 [Sorex fumeus]|uniref:osteoclast-associated immunoglobulin-like receptor isoform X2 n=1 Tax=Sorex fumeus TaxID=62283 RepID=UPI0024AD2E9D|nr:osteoclast-associated immunoglobulin-like receptor isoform X2 [Sorex fumeus]